MRHAVALAALAAACTSGVEPHEIVFEAEHSAAGVDAVYIDEEPSDWVAVVGDHEASVLARMTAVAWAAPCEPRTDFGGVTLGFAEGDGTLDLLEHYVGPSAERVSLRDLAVHAPARVDAVVDVASGGVVVEGVAHIDLTTGAGDVRASCRGGGTIEQGIGSTVDLTLTELPDQDLRIKAYGDVTVQVPRGGSWTIDVKAHDAISISVDDLRYEDKFVEDESSDSPQSHELTVHLGAGARHITIESESPVSIAAS